MVIKQLCIVMMALLMSVTAFAAGDADLQIRVRTSGATVAIDQVVSDGKAVVSVADARNKPLLGLTTGDFSVAQSGRKGKVTSVQPFSENQDVPRHIVLVLDNSYSMYDRKAIKSLLAGVGELLKTIRPVDDVRMVIFDNKKTVSMGGRDLHVQTLASNKPAELQAFAANAYTTGGLTGGTALYEALLAGLDLIKTMPATEPRFMVVFSDGEDLNSVFKKDDVLKQAKGLGRFKVYAIDYMERPATDVFLTRLARDNGGQIWKAKSESNLVSIFQSVASRMQHYYVVNYLFPGSGNVTVAPSVLTIDEVSSMGSTATASIDAATLTLRPVLDSAYGIARWKAVVSNARGSVAELAGEGAPAAELKIPLPATDLPALAANGDLNVRMELEDRRGQSMTLNAAPVTIKRVQSRASMTVAPASLKIEEIKTIDVSPMLGHIYFDKESGEILPRYARYSGPAETNGFDEQKFAGTLEKYYQDLNIVGKRMSLKPEATLTLIGCNDNSGREKGNKKLSIRRAEAVRDYLGSVWNIAPGRMTIEARNLPAKPSSIKLKQGQAENRRVEIVSTDPSILAPIRSTYLSTRIDTPTLAVKPAVVAPHGVAQWRLTAGNSTTHLVALPGKGALPREISITIGTGDLKALATGGDITVKLELQDKKGHIMAAVPDPVKVEFIQTSQRLAQKQGLRVQEKYALILFDFDKQTIDSANQGIINRIVARIKALPQATVEITGRTDNTGTEAYNLKLSERRALAVHSLLSAGFDKTAAARILYRGIGAGTPMFDNLSPEARAFNRTVTITLEYLSEE